MAETVKRTSRLKKGGYSRRHVEKVIQGAWKNEDILIIAAEVVADYEKNRQTKEAQALAILESASFGS